MFCHLLFDLPHCLSLRSPATSSLVFLFPYSIPFFWCSYAFFGRKFILHMPTHFFSRWSSCIPSTCPTYFNAWVTHLPPINFHPELFSSTVVSEHRIAEYSRTPDERPPSPTTIPLIRPHFVWRTVVSVRIRIPRERPSLLYDHANVILRVVV